MKKLRILFQYKYLLLLVLSVLVFFYPVFIAGKIPLPADTIVGMYHPWRDVVWNNLTSGVPFKNFLITDPVRQQYVWRYLSVSQIKKGQLPVWNPYSFSGTPLLANFQTASFYPLNILFFILPFNLAWTILIILQPLLAGTFLYTYLRFLKIGKSGSFLGGFTFAFCGFSVAWLEWNTIVQTVLWLPLILLAKEHLLGKTTLKWVLILIFAEISSFFAGHLQVLFYTLIISNVYLLIRIGQVAKILKGKNSFFKKYLTVFLPFLIIGIIVISITAIQWLPTLQFILQSSRGFDQGSWGKVGWFIPWQNLIQFLVPDFFGNPATGNYWGIWNYGEFIGYIGLIPLIFVLYGIIFARDKKTKFFGLIGFLALIFALPTALSKLPYILNLPLISTSQPTRLMVIVDFSLSILAALGFDNFIKSKSLKRMLAVLLPLGLVFLIIWIFIFLGSKSTDNLLIAKRNLILPTLIFTVSSIFLIIDSIKRKFNFSKLAVACYLLIVIFDLFRFGWKFIPFSNTEWVYPPTKIISRMQMDIGNYRVMSTDRRIMPPNFSVKYRLQDVSGYDPLYLTGYAHLVASWERMKPDITDAPFNRIITPGTVDIFFPDLMGVKYILSMDKLKSEKLNLVYQEGNTLLYQNLNAYPRAFFVDSVLNVQSDQEQIEKMFTLGPNLRSIAVTGENILLPSRKVETDEIVEITRYDDNYISLDTKSGENRLMVLTDIYYPGVKVYIDNQKVKLYRVDLSFRGVIVPKGIHKVEFRMDLI